MDFTHLHTHSHYSLLDGLPKINDLVSEAKKQKMSALALTDHGSMYGVIEFYQTCLEKKIKPIIGVEVYIAPNGLHSKKPKLDEKPYHLILLAKNNAGYQNLLKLVSIAHLEGFYYKPRIDLETLNKFKDGIICLSACLQGEISKAAVNHGFIKAEKITHDYLKIFSRDNFYLELQHHPNLPNQKIANDILLQIAKKNNIQLVATNDIHYLKIDDAEAQDILLCIQMKKELENTDRLSMMGEDFSFRPSKQMAQDFKAIPEALKNTIKIASQCHLNISLGKIQLPHYDLPVNITPDNELKKICQSGLKLRFGNNVTNEINKRLDYELSIITKTGFASYFLIVQDFVNWAKKNKIVVGPGRGSAAGSMVAFLTGITNIDPIKYDLLFERFLNPERISMPDIDMDFADTRRDEVIHYVEKKYGYDHVAQIITFGTMAARAAVRDVGRVMGLSYSYCDKLAKMIPMFTDLTKALKIVPELKEIYQNDPDAVRLLDSAKKLEGVARHASTHACGVVITDKALDNYTSLQYDSHEDKTIITQYSLHPIESLGLLKMDFLGLKNLSIIEDTINLINKTIHKEINIEKIPLNDKKTFTLLQKGQTTGVFQLESSGMKRYLKSLQPTEFEDIIAMVALYRPGPMEWIPDFISGKHGEKRPRYLHPKLKNILDKTYGVAIYQEQLMQIARDLAGFTLGEADVLRKAIAKKIPKLLAEQKNKFISGCIKNNISKNIAESIFNFIEPFAGYGFNRSHAACYAMIAYQTAYLKANWPTQFIAALLTSDYGNTDRIAIEVQEAEQMGIKVLPPDINESYSSFTVVKESLIKNPRIRFGLSAIKNVGDHIVSIIIAERQQNGYYKNLEDFLSRIHDKDLNKKSLESLIKSGAFDCFLERNQMLNNIENLLNFTRLAQYEKNSGQTNLFGQLPTQNIPKLTLAFDTVASNKQKLSWEKELLGLYISSHPLAEYKSILQNINIPFSSLSNYINKEITVIGVLTSYKKIFTRKGEPMIFAKLQDQTHQIEILFFPKTYLQYKNFIVEDNILSVYGKISDKDGEIKILVEKAEIFDPSKINISKHILIQLPVKISKKALDDLKLIIKKYPGRFPVYLKVQNKEIDTKMKSSFQLKEEIEGKFGKNNVFLV